MQYKKLGLVIYFFSLFSIAFNQTKSDNFNFISPVDFPIYLSGNFGEIRAEHFHSGIDIKTQGVEGKKIFAIENGHISRIKISANGYGKTLYIEHPNGYTSVYAHLSRFNHVIDKIVKELQYENKTFEINYFPKPNEIPVKKGQVIAFSGNTGRSFGPHLHFEIRETNYQVPVNPLIFNFEIKDNIAPQINHVAIYPLSNNSKINHQHNKLIIPAIKSNGNYILQDTSLLLVEGNIGFGIELYDYLNGSNNKCGIYTLSLFIDSLLVYNHEVDKVTFGETAYVKSHIDFAERNATERTIQKTFIAPNNQLSLYKSVQNRGIFTFTEDTTHLVKLVASDVYGNTSSVSFKVKGQHPELPEPYTFSNTNKQLMHWDTENVFENEEIKIKIPENALFDTLIFSYSTSDTNLLNAFSKIHHIHNENIPLFKKYSLSLKIKKVQDALKSKLFIARIEADNTLEYIGGEVINDVIVAETNTFGRFMVISDTLNPIIIPLLSKKGFIHNNGSIRFLIKDTLSGIESYNGFIDNNWALFEYDAKNDLLFYTIDNERIEKNKEHELELFVMDKTGNITTYYQTFYW